MGGGRKRPRTIRWQTQAVLRPKDRIPGRNVWFTLLEKRGPRYITPKNILTVSTDDGDLVYVVRASLIEDKAMMSKVTVEQLVDYLLYVKEVHSLGGKAMHCLSCSSVWCQYGYACTLYSVTSVFHV